MTGDDGTDGGGSEEDDDDSGDDGSDTSPGGEGGTGADTSGEGGTGSDTDDQTGTDADTDSDDDASGCENEYYASPNQDCVTWEDWSAIFCPDGEMITWPPDGYEACYMTCWEEFHSGCDAFDECVAACE
jgi:hypothetical protein